MQTMTTELVVIGSGPGGYAAAFRAAALGKKVILVEKYPVIGGVCLNVGCIPSKALLHVAQLIHDAKNADALGLDFSSPKINLDKIRASKDAVVNKLTAGLKFMAKKRRVEVVTGRGEFISPHQLSIQGADHNKQATIEFEHAVIATGSWPVQLPFIPKDPRIMDSTGALDLKQTQGKMLIIGGGIIGLEMATVYHALGTEVTIVEAMPQIIPGADADLVKPLFQTMSQQYHQILLNTAVAKVEPKKDGVWVSFKGEQAPKDAIKYDFILVAVGRRPQIQGLGLEKLDVSIDAKGFITVDSQMRTNLDHIYAIGDVVGQPMLAHKATYEGRLAAEVIAGKQHFNDARCIPSVAYTHPEIAWVGVTEVEAAKKDIPYKKAIFPWAANGRALSLNCTQGLTKLLCAPDGLVIGAGIVGQHAGDLIAEAALAIEMGATAEDIALTIHPHPTLSETMMVAAEVYEGTPTDIL